MNMQEELKSVVGHEDRYRISNLTGTVIRLAFAGKQGSYPVKMVKICTGRDGHQTVRLKRKSYWVHRLVLEAFVGPCPKGMQCCHNDGDPTNNSLSNLRWDTPLANAADTIKHRKRHNLQKLEAEYIPQIREMLSLGWTLRANATLYGVKHSAIGAIHRNETWRHA